METCSRDLRGDHGINGRNSAQQRGSLLPCIAVLQFLKSSCRFKEGQTGKAMLIALEWAVLLLGRKGVGWVLDAEEKNTQRAKPSQKPRIDVLRPILW